MVATRETRAELRRRRKTARLFIEMDRTELCKRLTCIAAFNLGEWPDAQAAVYAAIRALRQQA